MWIVCPFGCEPRRTVSLNPSKRLWLIVLMFKLFVPRTEDITHDMQTTSLLNTGCVCRGGFIMFQHERTILPKVFVSWLHVWLKTVRFPRSPEEIPPSEHLVPRAEVRRCSRCSDLKQSSLPLQAHTQPSKVLWRGSAPPSPGGLPPPRRGGIERCFRFALTVLAACWSWSSNARCVFENWEESSVGRGWGVGGPLRERQ